ncbi:MAG: hypothetical protein JXR73_09310 [Candidatus Omnitrophica bacterium]|nr:hypothetical protein [Candidatus Omnitrophota bacterium]
MTNEYGFPQPPEPPHNNDMTSSLVKEISYPLYQSKIWLRIIGIISILSGIISIFTIIGILFCWIPIWLGVLLYQSATSIEIAQLSGSKEKFTDSLDKLRLYFLIMGIMTLLGVIVSIFALGFGMLGVIFGV